MDIVTQGLLGGVVAQAVATRQEKKLATFIGLFAGMLADADILIRSASDPLLNIEYHRHFTHSLFFVPLGAALAWLMLWPLLRKRIQAGRLYLFCFAGYSLSGVLDACTSYGTLLFWPLSETRIALNIIAIIDPLFTLILLLALLFGLRGKTRRMAYAGLMLCAAYLALGYMQHQRAQALARSLIDARGHVAAQHIVKPTLANLLLWRSVYMHDGYIQVDAVRVGLFGPDAVYQGEAVRQFAMQADLPELEVGSILYEDIRRFTAFSEGYVAFDPQQAHVLGDIRYSMSPISTRPLWGIVIDRANPDVHADYRFFRMADAQQRRLFINMLFGRCTTTAECL